MIKKAITNQLYFKDNGTQGAIDRTADNALAQHMVRYLKTLHHMVLAYTASTGELILDIANHGLSVGDRVKIADNALTFTCGMDGNYSNTHILVQQIQHLDNILKLLQQQQTVLQLT